VIENMTRHIHAGIRNNETVLEVGSGHHPNIRSDVLCDKFLYDTRERNNVPLLIDRPIVIGDAEELPFKDNSFDAVFSGFTLHHLVNDINEIIKELKRVLKPKGFIFLIEPNKDSLFEKFQRTFHPYIYTENERAITIKELKEWFKEFDTTFWLEHLHYRIEKKVKYYRIRKTLNNFIAKVFPYMIFGICQKQ
jgi:ubiquinone/menaquinone biosynthesis C-methylase UbiE